jgi:LysM repeat protein
MTLLILGGAIALRSWMINPTAGEDRDTNLMTFKLVPNTELELEPVIKVAPKKKTQPKIAKLAENKDTIIKGQDRYVSIKNPREVMYEIQEGDTLQKISLNFYGTTKKYILLTQVNPQVNPSRLKLGERIKIPNLELSDREKQEDVLLHYQNPTKRPYTIKQNEVLSIIAAKELGSSKKVKSILEVNPGLKPDKIRAGQKIFIPTVYKPESR